MSQIVGRTNFMYRTRLNFNVKIKKKIMPSFYIPESLFCHVPAVYPKKLYKSTSSTVHMHPHVHGTIISVRAIGIPGAMNDRIRCHSGWIQVIAGHS